jgi:pimeloyl-ACP methyl ester carboxylesterase
MHNIRTIIGAVAAALVVIGGCALAAPSPSTATFAVCPDAGSDPTLSGSLCAHVQAPLDYSQPQGETVDLFLREFPAAGRSRGQVWLVAGGPGESGASFYPLLATLRTAFAGYDLIIPDHRGTGFSSRLCPKEEAPESPGGSALEGAEWETCFATLSANRQRTQAFTISNAARDLQGLMDRYSDGRAVWLYGASYGTQLVLRTLTIAPPRRLDGVVLDSLVPPETTDTWDLSHRSAVADAVGRRVLADCDTRDPCGALVRGSAEAELREIEADPKLSALVPGGRPKLFFGSLLDVPALRAQIPAVIAGLRNGDATAAQSAAAGLRAFGETFNHFPQSPASIPLVSLISASENNARPGLSKAQVDAEAEPLLFASSLPDQLVGGSSNAYPRDAAFGRHPKSLPPMLVLQGDMDPKTPHEGAVAHIRLLPDQENIHLVTIEGGPHFLLLTAPDCFMREVASFIAQGTPQSDVCRVG